MKIGMILAPIVIVNVLFTFFCCKSKCGHIERMEGFKGDSLRIYLRINLADEASEEKIMGNINDYILKHGRIRAINLLESQIKISISNKEGSGNAVKMVPDAVKAAKIVYKECNDEYCEAFIDYDIKGLKKIIQINSNPPAKE